MNVYVTGNTFFDFVNEFGKYLKDEYKVNANEGFVAFSLPQGHSECVLTYTKIKLKDTPEVKELQKAQQR